MLTQTLDESMAKAQKYEHTTRVAKFGNVFKTIVKDASSQNEIIMRKKLDEYTKKGYRSFDKQEEDKEKEFIVENPNEIKVNIDFGNKNSLGLPFFKSISTKLNKIYG